MNGEKLAAKIFSIFTKIAVIFMIIGVTITLTNNVSFTLYNNFLTKDILSGLLTLNPISYLFVAILFIILAPVVALCFITYNFFKEKDYKAFFISKLIFIILLLYILLS